MAENTQEFFLRAVFSALDEECVCYAVLHSWQALPRVAVSDIDMIVDKNDKYDAFKSPHDTIMSMSSKYSFLK